MNTLFPRFFFNFNVSLVVTIDSHAVSSGAANSSHEQSEIHEIVRDEVYSVFSRHFLLMFKLS